MTTREPLRVPRGHLVHTLSAEHATLLEAAKDLIRLTARAHSARDPWTVVEELRELARRLGAAERLYEREERVVFSRLELRGITEAPFSLRRDHDAIRLEVKALRELAAGPDEARAFRRALRRIRNVLVPLIRDHVRREDGSLLPLALEVIGEDAWAMMRLECDAIGAAPSDEAFA